MARGLGQRNLKPQLGIVRVCFAAGWLKVVADRSTVLAISIGNAYILM
jgi:hypothetical protein